MRNIAFTLTTATLLILIAACEREEPVAAHQPSGAATATSSAPVRDAADVEQDLTLPVGSHDWTSRIVVGQSRNAAGEVVASPSLDPSQAILVDLTLTEAPEGVVGRLELRRDGKLLADAQVPVDETTRRARLEMKVPEALRGSGRADLLILVGAAEQQRIPVNL